MIDSVKEKIWAILKDKEVSLAMIYDDHGEILWHRGRKIVGNRIAAKGCGFCSTPAQQVLQKRQKNLQTLCVATYTELHGSESARVLNVKSLVVLPIADHYFLYVDSGVRESFGEGDLAVFDSLGSLLSGFIKEFRCGVVQDLKLSGASPQMEEIREKILRFAIEEEPVLLLGETGVGKSHIAELIHQVSGRKGPFVVVNTPGIPDTLIESQLFGHRKGSFSGAVADAEGFVAAAEKGTLFLDEIAEIEPALQAKLLRFLDTKKYHRLGETAERTADVRLIAATNRNLRVMIGDKTFREDLFFRLNCLTIEIPPLRQRRSDIEALIQEKSDLLRGKTLAPEALQALCRYDWPGNVRELIQTLKVAGIQLPGPMIGTEIGGLLAFRDPAASQGSIDKVERIWGELKNGKSFWDSVKAPYLQRELNREEAKEIIERGLRETRGKYAGLVGLFNLDKKEYKNFMRFLYENHLK